MFDDALNRPLTLPNFLDSKRPVKSHKPSYHGRPAPGSYYGSYDYGGSAHGHDFTPLRGERAGSYRGGGADDPSGYSYGASDKYFGGDYGSRGPPPPPTPSSSSYYTAGPKSFVSVSSRLKEYAPDGAAIDVDHGYGYDTAAYDDDDDGGRYRYRGGGTGGGPTDPRAADYESADVESAGGGDPALHPSRDFRSRHHDGEHHIDGAYPPASSPYFVTARGGAAYGGGGGGGGDDDYGEPSSSRAEWTGGRRDDGGRGAPVKRPQKAYWRMSYTQDV